MKELIRTTHIKVEFETTLGDTYDKDTKEEDIKDRVESHIKEWCEEICIDRKDVKIIGSIDGEI